jgi:hypothetical protein
MDAVLPKLGVFTLIEMSGAALTHLRAHHRSWTCRQRVHQATSFLAWLQEIAESIPLDEPTPALMAAELASNRLAAWKRSIAIAVGLSPLPCLALQASAPHIASSGHST